MQSTMQVHRRCLHSPRARISRPTAVRCLATSILAGSIYSQNGNGNGVHQVLMPIPAAPAPVSSAPAPAPAPPATLPGPAAFQAIATTGAWKALLSSQKVLFMGILAGAYIAVGGVLSITVCGNVPGLTAANPGLAKLLFGAIFPVGLVMTLVLGAELYTGNTMLLTAAYIEKKAKARQVLHNLGWALAGNTIGALLMVAAVHASGLFAANPMPAAMAVAKTSLTFQQAFVRGILCNWMVCCAIWLATSSASLPGKVLGAYLPVMAFVTIGFEHSIANIFFLFMGIANGAPVSIATAICNNLIPVTLGNTIGGALCVAAAYGYGYGALGQPKTA